MDIVLTILLTVGIAFIGIAIFAKIRPDIMWKDRMSETILPPERQKFGFILLLLLGIMILVSAGAISIPQWQSHIDATLISIVMVTISVVLFMMWKYILLQRSTRGQQEMGDCSPEVLATSSEQQRPSIVKTNSMLPKTNK